MAIQPIDLQTLFTQMDKVGKAQFTQREGMAVQQAIQGAHLQHKIEENIRSVNETQNTGEDGSEKVKDKGPHDRDSRDGKKKDARQEDEGKEDTAPVIRDLYLGRKIDISL